MKRWRKRLRQEIGVGDPVLLELAIQRGLADAEQTRGHKFVSVQVSQGGEDGLLLHLGDGANFDGERRVSWRELGLPLFALDACVLKLRRQVSQMQDRTAGECKGAFERVLELANIAGPIVIDQKAESVLREGVMFFAFKVKPLENARGQQGNVLSAVA